MHQLEKDYAFLIARIFEKGITKETRNGETKSIFGEQLKFDMSDGYFPIMQGRKMFVQGVLGEYAAIIRQPKTLADFEAWGCNYWSKWAKEDGSINVDYGNAWFANGQIAKLRDALLNNPNDRRMIINAWRPENLDDLDLPCCHYDYQFYVAENTLHLKWTQRSVDTMIGLPSDFILAGIMLKTFALEFGYLCGTVTMHLGDCHIYEEHYDGLIDYLNNVEHGLPKGAKKPTAHLAKGVGTPFEEFEPKDLVLSDYFTYSPIKLELKA